ARGCVGALAAAAADAPGDRQEGAGRRRREARDDAGHGLSSAQKGFEITSPPLRVPMARHVRRSIEFLMKCTDPSPISMFTPPGGLLVGGPCIAMFAIEPVKPRPAQVLEFGVETWLYVVQHISPMTQLIPWRLVSGTPVAGTTFRHVE